MPENINLDRIFQIYTREFAQALRDAAANVKNSKRFTNHDEILDLETRFDELIHLTSFETFGRLEDLLKTPETDNRANHARLRTLVEKLPSVFAKIREHVDRIIAVLNTKPRTARSSDLKDQIEVYRISSALTNLENVRDHLRTFTDFCDAARALLALPYAPDIDYNPRTLDLDTIRHILETLESRRLRSRLETTPPLPTEPEPQTRSERFERVVLGAPKDGLDWSEIAVFCGFRSSQDTLGSKEQYLDAVRKYVKRLYDHLRTKPFILPKFHYILKDYVFNRIRADMENLQILYLIRQDGEKIYPFDEVRRLTEEFFSQTTRPYLPTTADYAEQAGRIQDTIFFEIAAIENAHSRQLALLTEEQKLHLILAQFDPENLELYRFLLPPQRTIEQIITDYLRQP